MSQSKTKIAVSLNLDWPLKRYHKLYMGIQAYNTEHCDWSIVWDHYPSNMLKNCHDTPYYSGVIGRIKYDTFQEAQRLGIPMVNTWMTSTLNELPSVFDDYAKAGKMAAEFLINHGFTNLVNIDYSGNSSSRIFYQQFSKSVQEAGCKVKQYLFSPKAEETRAEWELFYHKFANWIKEWELPVGIACSMSSLGPKTTVRLLENGLQIPKDAAILTCGNDPNYCETTTPPTSSIEMDFFKVGYEAARMMDQLLQGKKLSEQHLLIPPLHIVPRESTDIYVSDDEEIKKALRFIADNFNKCIQVDDVVDQVNVSRRSLEIRFQNEVKHSINKEINRLRINSLKRHLLKGNVKLSKVYSDFGFSNTRHLHRTFLKFTGMTPGEFIKSNK